jgi:hypothetical protein
MVRMPRAFHVRRRGSCFAVPRLAYQGLAVGGWPLAVGGWPDLSAVARRAKEEGPRKLSPGFSLGAPK